jgi:hypothetical protein
VGLLPELKVELVLLGLARSLELVAALPRIEGLAMEQLEQQPPLRILKQEQRIPLLL